LVKRRGLLTAGVSRDEIRTRLDRGSLVVEYPGVYRVGHRAPSVESSYLAAVWACGDDAFLRGRAAAYLLALLKSQPPPPEVMAPTKRSIEGIVTSRYRSLHRDEVMRWRGIPVTSVARTLVDLAPVLPLDELARACHEAGVRLRTTPRHVEAVLRRRPTAPGAAKLRAVMNGDARVLLSKLESGFIALLREDDLPLPETNRPAGSHYVDCRWPDHRLTVELDSFRYHNSRQSWERDRHREREARARGDEFRRYTWADVFEQPRLMLTELHSLLPSSDPI
jgi:very-short-patch-repair endonuclease